LWREDIVPLASSGANRYVDNLHYERFRPEFKVLMKIFHQQAYLPMPLDVD
jgi:hypothetical protein